MLWTCIYHSQSQTKPTSSMSNNYEKDEFPRATARARRKYKHHGNAHVRYSRQDVPCLLPSSISWLWRSAAESDSHRQTQHKVQCVKTGARLPQLPAASRFIVISIALSSHARIYIKNKQTKTAPLCCGRRVKSWGNSPLHPWVTSLWPLQTITGIWCVSCSDFANIVSLNVSVWRWMRAAVCGSWGGLSQARVWLHSFLVSHSAAVFSANTGKDGAHFATLRLPPPLFLPLHARTELAFTVQYLEELHHHHRRLTVYWLEPGLITSLQGWKRQHHTGSLSIYRVAVQQQPDLSNVHLTGSYICAWETWNLHA